MSKGAAQGTDRSRPHNSRLAIEIARSRWPAAGQRNHSFVLTSCRDARILCRYVSNHRAVAARRRRPMKSKNRLGRLAFLFAMLVLGAPCVSAQGTGGRISGTVVDSSGAVLPGATVTIVQEQTKLTKSTTTDKDGAYLFVSLPV